MIMDAKMVPQSPSKVCGKCYDEADADYNTRWLPWLECARPNDHAQEKRVTVIVGDDHEVIEVAEIPSHLMGYKPSQLCGFLCQCSDSAACKRPHSQEELEYWKWCNVHQRLGTVYLLTTL